MKNSIIFFVVVVAVFAAIYYIFFSRNKIESNWAPEFRDPKKDMLSMTGNEGDSVAGMIANSGPVGSMTHAKR